MSISIKTPSQPQPLLKKADAIKCFIRRGVMGGGSLDPVPDYLKNCLDTILDTLIRKNKINFMVKSCSHRNRVGVCSHFKSYILPASEHERVSKLIEFYQHKGAK